MNKDSIGKSPRKSFLFFLTIFLTQVKTLLLLPVVSDSVKGAMTLKYYYNEQRSENWKNTKTSFVSGALLTIRKTLWD